MKIKYRFCLLHVHIYLHRNNEDSLCGQLKLFSKFANISTKCSPWGWSYKCVVEMLASLPNIIHRESSLLFKNKVATHSAKMGLRVLREIWHCWRQNCERSLNAISLPFSVCTLQQKLIMVIINRRTHYCIQYTWTCGCICASWAVNHTGTATVMHFSSISLREPLPGGSRSVNGRKVYNSWRVLEHSHRM